ncbi:MAG: hypothetical protein ABI837_11475 [Acidobacteriota bacterium]
MFEYFQESVAAQARRVGAPPLAALILTQGYFAILPIIRPSPWLLVWLVEFIAFAGAIAGLIGTVALLVRSWRQLDVRAGIWLALSLLLSLFVGQTFLSMTFPWL